MATPPDKSKPAERRPAAPDPFLDPLPVPDATESNTDTAWGLWEHTLRAHDGEAQVAPDTDFEDTLPSDSAPQGKKP